MKKLIVVFLLFAVVCYAGCYIALSNIPITAVYPAAPVYNEEKEKGMYYRKKEADVLSFINRNLIGQNGEIFTHIKAREKESVILSESIGLMLNYYLLKDAKDMFDKELTFLKENMLVENRYVKWKTGDNITCGAAVDDLRIVRVLLDAYDKWEDEEYYNMAGFIQDGLYNKQVIDYNLYEFYDWKQNVQKNAVPLCYLDPYTMYRMSRFNSNWIKVSQRALFTAKNGRIGEDNPFFQKYFNYKTGEYSKDEEYKSTRGICLTYTLYTVIHLAEMNEDTAFFCAWLKNEMDKGKLFVWYDPETLKPASNVESTAVYALAAVYASMTGENELYEKLIHRMLQFMVPDEKSPYYGGFGNADTGEFYSFDNLTALWALALAGE